MVSVIIPFHDNNSTIDKCVDSVLNQTYGDVEIIIVDNGSTQVLKLNEDYMKTGRINVITVTQAIGVARARNLGVQSASGEYVAFLDADDFWAPDKLHKQLKVMTKFRVDGEEPILCFTGRQFVDKDGNILKRYVGCNKVVRYEKLLESNQINCSSVIMKRETALKNVFPDGKLHEDYAAWLRLLMEGGYAAGINQPLLYYRFRFNSRSGNKLRSAVMHYRVYRYIGLGRSESVKHMFTYTAAGIKKYL